MCSLISRRFLSIAQKQNILAAGQRFFCDNKHPPSKSGEKESDDILGSIATKYQIFRNEESSTILDINEERFKYAQFLEQQEDFDIYAGLNLNRMYKITSVVAE